MIARHHVGQTKRQIATRVREHRVDINKKSGTPSVITSHRLESNHEMQRDKILISEVSHKKRLISEMIHIKRQQLPLNKQSNTDMLSNTYQSIIDHLSLS